MRGASLLFLLLPMLLFAGDTESIFLGTVERHKLPGKRVSVHGNVEATGCDDPEKPCRVLAVWRYDGAKLLFTLTFREIDRAQVSRKKVLDPIHASCVYIDPFHYKECIY